MAQRRTANLVEQKPNGLMAVNPGAWLSTMAECQREMLEFMASRLEKDGETIREAVSCRNIGDALAVQSRWIDEALHDYSNEATRLIGIYSRATEDVVRNATPRE